VQYEFLIKKAKPFLSLPSGHSKHFSFLVKRRNIVGFGYNKSFVTHPLARRYGYRFSAVHSELDCILSFNGPPRELSRYTMINIRFMADGSLGLSKPCPICQSLLKSFGITDVLYSTKDGFRELQDATL